MWQDRSFCKPISREKGFSTRPERQKTPTTSENVARGIQMTPEEIQEQIDYEDSARVSVVCGRLRSITARRTGSYQLLVDSGAAINLIKEKILDKQDIRQKHFKKFVMGRDELTSTETAKLSFFNKEHVFHIIPNDFPLPDDGIIGLKFFSKYDRYTITPNFLVLDKKK